MKNARIEEAKTRLGNKPPPPQVTPQITAYLLRRREIEAAGKDPLDWRNYWPERHRCEATHT